MDNEKPVFVMMVGLPASGKSTVSAELAEKYDATVFSSDALRKELFGDESNQGDSRKLFAELHRRIKKCLRDGGSAIYDATNISSKRRREFLQELAKIDCRKECVVMATPYKQCLENNRNRDRQVPEHVIERMYRHWNTPYWFEGWDEIELRYWGRFESYASHWSVFDYWHYGQDNPYHSLSLGEHCFETGLWCRPYGEDVFSAALVHDCGKPFTKQFKDSKGNPAEHAHYYGHENVGAYDAMFFFNPAQARTLFISTLVNLHMKPYEWERGGNERLRSKYRELWGEELYLAVMELHEADKKAH